MGLMDNNRLPVISLFSGALGLDLGLERAGFEILVAVECNRFAAQTIRDNRPDIKVIERKIEHISTEEILENAGLRPGDPVIVTGGPSCQAFSTAGQRGSFADPRGVMFLEFLRVVREAQPRFFIMENVKGILSAAIRHRPLKERGPAYPPLDPDEELGSAFFLILTELKSLGYHVLFDVLNAADYGVPQARERVIFIGSRDCEMVRMPTPTHSRNPVNGKIPWVTLREGLDGLVDPDPQYSQICPAWRKYLELIPEGGNWRDLPSKMWPEALGGAYRSWGGRSGILRRLSWDKPSPALTTKPSSKVTMICHPSQSRPLSLKEYARLQQFPDEWQFAGGLPQQYIQIGNAVPVGLGLAIGSSLIEVMKEGKRAGKPGVVTCYNKGLIERLGRRPDTFLNPRWMRDDKDQGNAVEWIKKCTGTRNSVLGQIEYVPYPCLPEEDLIEQY